MCTPLNRERALEGLYQIQNQDFTPCWFVHHYSKTILIWFIGNCISSASFHIFCNIFIFVPPSLQLLTPKRVFFINSKSVDTFEVIYIHRCEAITTRTVWFEKVKFYHLHPLFPYQTRALDYSGDEQLCHFYLSSCRLGASL